MFDLNGNFTTIAILVAGKGDFTIQNEESFYATREISPVYVWICPYAEEISNRTIVMWDTDVRRARHRQREAQMDI